jgi:hypothetical protein
MSSCGDFGPYRKVILIWAAIVGAASSIAFVFITKPQQYGAAAAMFIIGGISIGLSIIMYNAYIPELARMNPEFLEAMALYKENKKDAKDVLGKTRVGASILKTKPTISATALLVDIYSSISDGTILALLNRSMLNHTNQTIPYKSYQILPCLLPACFVQGF